ncbi:O-antigen ligase, partial [Kocuria sp. CNJ-770]|uniref:O-antigen ligase family protein n=1 Tax=Kocuria sp. CNJ-770 TaxID=1904964 RepID=UPI0013018D13
HEGYVTLELLFNEQSGCYGDCHGGRVLLTAFIVFGVLEESIVGLALVLSLPALMFIALIAIKSSNFRLYAFIGIGMLVMQSESGWSAALKPAYFLMVALFGLISIRNTKYLHASTKAAFRPIFLGSGLLTVLIILYVVYSVLQGQAPSRVIRDAFTYVLVAVSPFIAADAARETTTKNARIFVAVATGLAALSFSVFWLAVRQVSILGIERILMFSMMLSGLGIIVGFVYGVSKLNAIWLGFGTLCLIAVLVTGTRSGLLLVLALVGAIGAKQKLRLPWTRVVPGLLLVVSGAYFLLPSLSARISTGNFLETRMEALLQVIEGGIESDASGQMRRRALEISLTVWRENPLLGVGFGQAFQSVRPGEPPVDFQLDSGMLLFAKFGIFGAVLVIGAIGVMLYGFLSFHKKTKVRSRAQTIAASFSFMVLILAMLGVPMEDKGFAYSLCLITYLLAADNFVSLRRRDKLARLANTESHSANNAQIEHASVG